MCAWVQASHTIRHPQNNQLGLCIPCAFVPAAVGSEGGCPDAAGLQLPASPWSGRVVSGAHLMSGKGDAAKWGRYAWLM